MIGNGNLPDDPAGREQQLQSRLLNKALTRSDITTGELWMRYFANGGTVGEYEVDAYIQSLLSLPPLQRDMLAQAANELIDELPPPTEGASHGRSPPAQRTRSKPATPAVILICPLHHNCLGATVFLNIEPGRPLCTQMPSTNYPLKLKVRHPSTTISPQSRQ